MPGGLASRRARYLGTLNLRTNTPGYRRYQSTNQKLKVSYPSYPRASVREPYPNISWFTCGQRCGVMGSEGLCTSPMPTFIRYKNSKMFISRIGLRHHAKMRVYDAKCTHSLRNKSEILLHPHDIVLKHELPQRLRHKRNLDNSLPARTSLRTLITMFKAWILGICKFLIDILGILGLPAWSSYAGSDWNPWLFQEPTSCNGKNSSPHCQSSSHAKNVQKHSRWLEGIDRLTSQGKINYICIYTCLFLDSLFLRLGWLRKCPLWNHPREVASAAQKAEPSNWLVSHATQLCGFQSLWNSLKLTVLCQQLYPNSLQTWRPSCDYGQNSPTNRPQWPQRWWWAVSLILHWPTIALDALWSWQLPGRLRRCESTRRQGGRRGWSAAQPRHHLLRHGLRLNPWSRPWPAQIRFGRQLGRAEARARAVLVTERWAGQEPGIRFRKTSQKSGVPHIWWI